MSKGLNAISRLLGCSTLLWQEQVKGQLSSLFPHTRPLSQPGSRASKRFQQPGKRAKQRREAKPAQVKEEAKPARLCFITLPLGQQVPARKDWDFVLLKRSHWASELLRSNHSLNEERLKDWTRTKTRELCSGTQLNGWMARLVGWGQDCFLLAVFEHESYCSSQHFMIFLHNSLFRLQPIHESACCNPLPWALFTCKSKSLQHKLEAVTSPESSTQLVNGNMWVVQLGIKLCLSDALHSGHWAVWCDAHLSLQDMRFSWCKVASL